MRVVERVGLACVEAEHANQLIGCDNGHGQLGGSGAGPARGADLSFTDAERAGGRQRVVAGVAVFAGAQAVGKKRRQRVAIRLSTTRDEGGAVEPPDASEQSRPEYALEQADEERRIQEALNRLSPENVERRPYQEHFYRLPPWALGLRTWGRGDICSCF